VTSLLSKWRPAIRVLTVLCGSGRVVPRLPGWCGVPSPGLIPAAPRTPVLPGVCKARSSPLAGWPDATSVRWNQAIECKAAAKSRWRCWRETPDISETLRPVGGEGERRPDRLTVTLQMSWRDQESRSDEGDRRSNSGAQPAQPPAFTISSGGGYQRCGNARCACPTRGRRSKTPRPPKKPASASIGLTAGSGPARCDSCAA
jgi:hypothetical protein